MGFDVKILPSKHSAAINHMPVSVEFLDNSGYDNYSFISNIVFYCREVSSMEPYFNFEVLTKVTVTESHNYEVGDTLMIFRGSSDNIGYYNIKEVLSNVEFVIDKIFVNWVPSPSTYIGRVIREVKDYNQYGRVNYTIDESCIDYLGVRIIDDAPFGVDSFNYFLVFGEQYDFIFNFYDNFSASGSKLGFYAGTGSYASVDDVPFEIGDEIVIQQDLFEWLYTDNIFTSGFLGFTSSNIHNWSVGDIVTVTGQITEPYYNGDVKVLEVLNSNSIRVDKTHSTSTPMEGGSIFGVPFPEYNTNATITDIYYDVTLGVCIVTDLDFITASQPISGDIKLLNGEQFVNYNSFDTVGFYSDDVFDYQTAKLCRFDRPWYINKLNNEYIAGSVSSNFSTILKQDGEWNRIDRNGSNFIKMRFEYSEPIYGTAGYADCVFYDYDNNILGNSHLVELNSNEIYDYDLGCGLDQILNNIDRVDIGTFSYVSEIDNIWRWEVTWYDMSNKKISKTLRFELDDDSACGLDVYNIMWLDSYGSYISFPFRYAPTESKDVDRSSYYKREGQWGDTDFTIDTSERGVFNFYNKSRSKIKLTSGFINDDENYLFKDLIESTDVYLSSNSEYIGFYSVYFGDDKIEFKDNRWDYLYYYEPTFYFSYNNYRRNNIISRIKN